MSAPIEFVSRRAFARLDGCSDRRVRNAVRDGDLPNRPDKMIPAALVGTPWRALNAASAAAADPVADPGQESAPSLSSARRRYDIVSARRRRAEWNRRSSEWVTKPSTTRSLQNQVRRLATIFATIAPAAAPLVVGKPPAAIAGALRDVVCECLTRACADDDPDRAPRSAAGPTDTVISEAMSRVEAQRSEIEDATRLRQLDLDIEAGVVVNVAAVAAAYGTALAALRSRLLALQAELPPLLFRKPQAAAERMINAAVTEAMADLRTSVGEIARKGAHAR
jgi:hypothetical protein